MGCCCAKKINENEETPLPVVEFRKKENGCVNNIHLSQEIDTLDATNVQSKSTTDSKSEKLAIALYSLKVKDEAILQFHKGDTLIIEEDGDPDWYLVRHKVTQRRGFAPKSYLILDTVAGEEEWFFDSLTRADAERLLLQPENIAGTFMVRNSRIQDAYALSIKEVIPDINEVDVRHYKIRTLDNGGFFISPKQTFNTLKQLIQHYSEDAHGLCRKLEKPCPRPKPVITGPLPTNRDEYEIPYDSLKFIHRIGKGNFGEVFYGFWNGTMEVAIKRLVNTVQSNDFRREVAVMKAISHPKIVRLFAICTEKEPFCIIMEYMCHGNLQQYLKTEHGKQLKLPSLVNMAAQISEGMKYLESEKLIHRDLAARNILVGDGDVVKLADFGLARIMDEEIYITSGGKLPVKWTAPEAYMSGEFTIKSDVWSFGIVLYEIFTHGGNPYPEMKNQQVIEALKKNYRMPKPNDPECSDAVYESMLLCWKTKPDERPTFEYLYHFFTDYYVASETSYKEAH